MTTVGTIDMKIKKYAASDERLVLTGMIVNDRILRTLFNRLGGNTRPFRSKFSNTIAKWCLEHCAKYKEAPKDAISNRFVQFQEKTKDTDTVELVEEFLSSLNKDYETLAEEMNPALIIDRAAELFTAVAAEKAIKLMGAALEIGDTESLVEASASFKAIDFKPGHEPDIFDLEQIKEWIKEEDSDRLIEWPQGLGEFLGDSFARDSFISFAGPEKRGKSYWLAEVVWQALKQKKSVLYYVVGDMGEKQAMKRLLSRITRLPLKTRMVRRPTGFIKKEDEWTVTSTEQEKSKMTSKAASTAMSKLKRYLATDEPKLRTKIYEASSICAGDIEQQIADMIDEGWMPDVVVIDYADILTAEAHAKHLEYRHQLNETWMVMRRISQRFRLCLVTATQTAASSYDAATIRKTDFSEDKRKAAHVTGMLGINQTAKEKVQGIYRLNWIFNRENGWADYQCVHTAGDLSIGCPCMVSELL